VRSPATATKTAINVLSLVTARTRAGTLELNAESADRIDGQDDECKKRPTTDVFIVSEVRSIRDGLDTPGHGGQGCSRAIGL
jgi:hypothetical protein